MLLYYEREKNHVINWMVVRHSDFSTAMESLEPNDLEDGLPSTAAFKYANNLIANMQIEGPVRSEFPKYRYDANQKLHHCHVTMGKNSYDVIWEVDETLRLIHVLDIATRENFDYKRSTNINESIKSALTHMLDSDSHKRIFSVKNMVVHPELKKMYEPFMNKKQELPIPPKDPIVNMTADEVKAAQRAEMQIPRSRHRQKLSC